MLKCRGENCLFNTNGSCRLKECELNEYGQCIKSIKVNDEQRSLIYETFDIEIKDPVIVISPEIADDVMPANEADADEQKTAESKKAKREVTDEELYDLYIVRQLSISQIGAEIGRAKSTVYNMLNKAGLIELKKTARRPKL